MTGIHEDPAGGAPRVQRPRPQPSRTVAPVLERPPAILPADRAPVKVCRRCSVQTETTGSHCPQCGKSFVRKNVISKRVALIASGGLVLILAAVVVLVLVAHNRDAAATRHRHAAAASSSAAAASASAKSSAAAVAARDAKQASDDAERAVRAEIVTELEASVKRDAEKDVQDGVLDGPILSVTCTSVGAGSADDLAANSGNFSCLAVTAHNSDGTDSGYGFTAVINWVEGSYSWHLGNQ